MSKRDNYFRCPYCFGLFPHDQCHLDPRKGYQCPNLCEKPFNQPPYVSPLNNDEDPD